MQKNVIIVPWQGAILQATLPLPPGVNNMYRNIKWVRADGKVTSRRAATPELLNFQKKAQDILKDATQNEDYIKLIRAYKEKEKFVALDLEIFFYYPTMWKKDVDSGIKALQDAIFTYLKLGSSDKKRGVTDTLVVDVHGKKRVDPDYPRCEFRLSFSQMGETTW